MKKPKMLRVLIITLIIGTVSVIGSHLALPSQTGEEIICMGHGSTVEGPAFLADYPGWPESIVNAYVPSTSVCDFDATYTLNLRGILVDLATWFLLAFLGALAYERMTRRRV